MGFRDRVISAKCGYCGKATAWHWKTAKPPLPRWKCACGAENTLREVREHPNVPVYLFVGPDKLERFKVYATPPEHPNESWAEPYTVRSFVAQASRHFGGCDFTCDLRGTVMGEDVYRDRCTFWEVEDADRASETDCHIVSGWSTGQASCLLWTRIAQLCQTEEERKFLHHYLRYVKDRQYPMLIPQARIGVAERRRPDFVLFLPLQHWNYRWLAIELDGMHGEELESADAARNAELAAHGYDVFSVRPTQRGYLEEVRRLVESVEEQMKLADSDPWKVAIEAQVATYTDPNEFPF